MSLREALGRALAEGDAAALARAAGNALDVAEILAGYQPGDVVQALSVSGALERVMAKGLGEGS